MQLKEVKFGHSYQHRTLGQCAIVSCHPHDGAALIVAYWDHENDDEKFVLAVPEDLLYILPDEPVMRTEGACMVTPVEAQIISDLIEVARAAWVAMEGAESPTYGVLISNQSAFKLADMLTVLDLLPDREHCLSPGYIKSAYALEHILSLLPNVQHVFAGSISDVHVNGRQIKQRIDGKPTLTPFFDSNLAAAVTATAAGKLADFITAEKLAEHIEAVSVAASKMANNSPWNSLDELGKSMRNAAESLHKFNVVVTQRPAGLSDSEWLVVQNMRKLDMAKIDFTTSIPEGFTFRPYSSILQDIQIQPPQSVMRMISGINVPDSLSDAQGHVLFTDEDNDAPKAICDRNGNVVLGLCKLCGKGEAELSEPCPGKKGDL